MAISILSPTPPNNSGNQNFEKMKKKKNTWRCHHFTQVEPNIRIICYTVPEIWHVTDVIFTFHFGLFFAVLPP